MAREMSEPGLHRNQGLFVDYFLNELLPQRVPEWQADEKIQKTFDSIKALYDRLKRVLRQQTEAQLEEKFIKEILKILGHIHYEVQPTLVRAASGLKKPDYALFPDEDTQAEAQSVKGKPEFFHKVLAIAEAKKWERPLDKVVKDLKDKDNPSLQMDQYLYYTEVPWGILTNGRYWRLYNRRKSKDFLYFEIDLKEILETGNLQAFKYFYFLFRRDAFPDFVEQIYQGSIDYAKELGDNLKESVYEALKILARGFLRTPRNNLDPEKDLKEIHDNCLILLYRIIFLLYAESPRRGERLLPLNNPTYRKEYSFYALKHRVRDMLARKSSLSPIKTILWAELKALFALVNQGSESMGIPKGQFFVPAYNGGLFDEDEHQFLEKYAVADSYLAQVIDLLAETPLKGEKEKTFADYGGLEIHHLGSIYEGLLEYRLGIAEEKLDAIAEKGKQKWIPQSEAKGKKTLDEVEPGDVYLYTDKGERKATGSYYTPDYIVDYIVRNTLGPIIEERKKRVKGDGTKLIEEIQGLKVVDPAMGSGHFLVAATDYLARALVEALGGSEKELEEDDIRWARREVIERCIFGVDLNPLAVELAKLSLWLSTVSKDKPLSFLDHHLRCGNSLIGAWTKALGSLPTPSRHKKQRTQLTIFDATLRQNLEKLLSVFKEIEQRSSDDLSTVEEKKRKYYEVFRPLVEPFIDVADLWISVFFGNEVGVNEFTVLQNALTEPDRRQTIQQWKWFQRTQELAEEKRFFHWELEFPEIWFERGQRRENPGFDAVIGNPPWGQALDKFEKRWLEFFYVSDSIDIMEGETNPYTIFLTKANLLTRQGGFSGHIVPEGWIVNKTESKLRKWLIENVTFSSIALLRKKVIPDAPDVIPSIPVFRNCKPISNPKPVIRLYGFDRPVKELPKLEWRDEKELHQADWLKQPYSILTINQTKDLLKCYGRMYMIGSKLSDSSRELAERLVYISDGIYKSDLMPLLTKSRKGRKVFWQASEIARYREDWSGLSVSDSKFKSLPQSDQEKYSVEKIILHAMKKPSVRYRITGQYFPADSKENGSLSPVVTNNFVVLTRKRYHGDLKFLLALLNCSLINMFYTEHYFQVNIEAYTLGELPIRRIFFTTSSQERRLALEQLRRQYQEGNFRSVLSVVESYVPKDENGNLQILSQSITVKEAVEKGFIAPEDVYKYTLTDSDLSGLDEHGDALEKSDVVHDFLTYLVKEIIEKKKAKHAETKGFLRWLEAYIGVSIEELKNKTKLRAYDQQNLTEFLRSLEQNHRRITKVDIKGREAREKIKAEFDNSMAKLKPVKERIEKTDWLIDEVVYRLYGLTDDEIKLVETHMKGRANDEAS